MIDSASFLGGCKDGRIIRIAGEVALVDHNLETTTERLSVLAYCNAPVLKLLVNCKQKILLAITDENILIKYKIDDDYCRVITELLTLKLASQLNDRPIFCWAGEMVLAMALSKSVIRLWDITRSDNYTLSPLSNSSSEWENPIIIHQLAYCPKYRFLAAGMNDGRIAVWKFCPEFGGRNYLNRVAEPEFYWQPQPMIDLVINHGREQFQDESLSLAVSRLVWDPLNGTLAASYLFSSEPLCEETYEECNEVARTSVGGAVFIMHQQPLCADIGGSGSAVVQISSQRLAVISSDPKHFTNLSSAELASLQTPLSSTMLDSRNFEKSIDMTEKVITVDEQLKKAFCTKEHVAVWNGRQIQVFKHGYNQTLSLFSTFVCEFELIGMYDQSLLTREDRQIHIRSLQGTVTTVLNLTESNDPICITHIFNGYLACLTDSGLLKVFVLTKKEAKQVFISKNLGNILPIPSEAENSFLPLGKRVAWISMNSDATILAFTLKSPADSQPDSKIFVWKVNSDQVQLFDLSARKEKSPEESFNEASSKGGDMITVSHINQMTSPLTNDHYPLQHYWDRTDPRLLVVEAAPLLPQNSCPGCSSSGPADAASTIDSTSSVECSEAISARRNESARSCREENSRVSSPAHCEHCNDLWGKRNTVISFFVNLNENRMIIQEVFQVEAHFSRLMGIEVPYFYFVAEPVNPVSSLVTESQPPSKRLARRVMREFVGLESADLQTREAVLNFSYFLAIGEMDAAFKSMRLIRCSSVWENMAKVCVITRRLEVGLLCLGKMGNAIGASMLRKARTGANSITAQTGELALQLGMTAEAERLFIEAGRWDLVTHLHRSMGNWKEALSVVEKHNRVRLRDTHYAYALELKKKGFLEEAIDQYEAVRKIKYSLRGGSKNVEELSGEIGSFCEFTFGESLEARGKLKEAIQQYSRVKDYVSMVRAYCCEGQDESALELCNETGDPAACCHLARQLEAKGDYDRAIQLYARARILFSAIRLCKEHGRNDRLYSLAQLGSQGDMLDAARHLEQEEGFAEKAVMLYYRAGRLNEAVDLAFTTHQFGALTNIICDEDFGSDCDAGLIRKCADFLVQNSQFTKAVEILAKGKQWLQAVQICTDHEIALTDELVEQLVPPEDQEEENARASARETRNEILRRLGEVCLSQERWLLACRLLSRTGDHVGAMRALLRSGDTSKIIFFANASRKRDLYVLAAHHLQTTGTWRSDPSIVSQIVGFYTRANALTSLAAFYEACAQVEIEEFQNYEKAIGALTEAYKALSRAESVANDNRREERLRSIKAKAMNCKKFIDAQILFEDDPVEALNQNKALLNDPDALKVIHPGQIFSTMVKGLVKHGRYRAAHACLQEMREKLGGLEAVSQYLDRATQSSIYRALDMTTPVPLESRGSSDDTIGDDIGESIEDNIDVALESDADSS
ncbi:hypothetical protein Aperf_G00000003534 [Anoplocephala perfoliata]